MRTIILTLLILFGLESFGQKLIDETFQNKGNTKYVTEKKAYYHNQTYLNSDSTFTKKRFIAKTGKQLYEWNFSSLEPEIRHGVQITFGKNDTIYFEHGMPTGIWNVNDFFKGKRVILDYNFQIDYAENEDWPNLPDIKINDHLKSFEKEPEFKGGFKGFEKYVYDNRYFDVFNVNRIALEIPKPAIVKLSFEISSTGDVTNVKIIKGVHPIYDKEAYRLILNSPDWKPAIQDGEPTNSVIYFWVHFQRDKNFE